MKTEILISTMTYETIGPYARLGGSDGGKLYINQREKETDRLLFRATCEIEVNEILTLRTRSYNLTQAEMQVLHRKYGFHPNPEVEIYL
jgi:hypothetical protein